MSGIVGIGSVGATTVGGGGWMVGISVAGTDVLVGRNGVFVGAKCVEVGCSVRAEVRVDVPVGSGSCVRKVAVKGKVDVGVGVRVADGVAVGMVEVMVGVGVGVRVGAVEVGNGPSSASEVRARAVLVPLAIRKRSRSPVGPRNANQSQRMAPSIRVEIPAARKFSRLLVPFNSVPLLFEPVYGYGGVVAGGTRVLVGLGGCGVRVRVGRGVQVGGRTGVFVFVGRAAIVRAVKVTNTCGVAVEVGVRVGVRVGVEVGEGISDAVGVGAVEVGNGPSSACAVSASAVRVLFASLRACTASGDPQDASA
jgi:hypothetical protein